jgi:hypothetical protein
VVGDPVAVPFPTVHIGIANYAVTEYMVRTYVRFASQSLDGVLELRWDTEVSRRRKCSITTEEASNHPPYL